MKKIKILATGGTISAHHSNRLDFRNYVSGHYSGEEIIETISEVREMAEIDVEQLSNLSSTLIDAANWIKLRERIHKHLNEEGYDGIMITHGTNTLEETAYFLNLTVHTDKPVVLTGAQRPLSGLSSDAPINLYNAIKVACSDHAKEKGVLVVSNDQINSARDVVKTNTYRLETFQSGEVGCLGFVDPDNTVQFYYEPTRRHTYHSEFSTIEISQLPHVEIVYSYAGAKGTIINSLVDSGDINGIVLAGTGAGRCSYEEEKAMKNANQKGIQGVLSTRCIHGRVVPLEKYDYLNAVTSDNLPPHKARILLMLALLNYQDPLTIQKIFDTY